MNKEYKKNIAFVVVTLSLILVTTTLLFLEKNYLVIKDAENDEIISTFRLKGDNCFAVEFRHSVNQSLVEDRYKVVDGEIMVYETLYYNFGAGVQTELSDGQTLIETEDGGMIVSGIDNIIDELIYRPSPVYDHILKINNQNISLTELSLDSDLLLFEITSSKNNK